MSDLATAVLVVDNNSAKRLAIASILRPLDLTIVEADSGEHALRALMMRAFAVILMDVQMPRLDGYETAKLIRMRVETERTPIIFVTSYSPDETLLPLGYANGAVDFIFAPLVAEIVRAKVSFFVDLFTKSRELERSLQDVTRLGEQFRDSEARTRAVLEHVADGIVTVSADGVIESFNRAAAHLFGYDEQDAVGRPFSVMIARGLPEAITLGQGARARMTRQEQDEKEIRPVGRRKDGTTFPIELNMTNVEVGSGRIFIGCVRDVSERQMYTETLQFQAVHDDLTGLPNRVLFTDRVDYALRAAQRAAESLAVLVMDLDEFKQVNDTLGHQRGDVLLKLVAERLRACLRESDTVARLGGDEFGILLPIGTDSPGAASVAFKIRQALDPPFLLGDQMISVRASVGATLFPDHGDSMVDLLRRADLAMYDAKRRGGGYAMFAAEQEDGPARRMTLLGELRRCLEHRELVLHYQPIVDLASQATIGLEALIRWNHPSGNLLMPDAFMPEVERNELIIPITQWVIDEALTTLSTCREAGYDLTMAVNLGARCLAAGSGIFEVAEGQMARLSIPSNKLIFELTETALIDTTVPGLMARLQSMDERLSIDDFGTGYSSLAYLQRLPVVEIKADRSFVTPLAKAADNAVIVRSIIDLGHNLSLNVVAEGVEDEETVDRLVEYGCDAAQGYFFSRAIPLVPLMTWLDTSAFRPTLSLGALHSVRAAPAA